MTALLIPANLRVLRQSFLPSNQTASGGVSASGVEQVVASPGGRWKASLTFSIRTEGEILAYRAFLVGLAGRANEVLVGPRDGLRPRDSSGARLFSRGVVPFQGGALFETGGGWSTPAVATGFIGVAAQQSTVITFNPQFDRGVAVGHYIGIGDRIYMATSVRTDASTGVQTVGIWPWLRVPAPDGTVVTLDKPLCRMRLATDDSGALNATWKEASTPTMDFVESFDA